MWETLIDELRDNIEAISSIQEVYQYDVEQFQGSPACTITPSENENDYITTEENVRIYVFKVRVYINRSVAPSGETVEPYADKILRGVVTDILDKLDKNYTLTGISSPTGYTFINVFAVPSVWGYAGREDEFRVAEITVRCRVSVDLTNLP